MHDSPLVYEGTLVPGYPVGFVQRTRNVKTGPIPVSTSSRSTCPSTCPLKENGCYAHVGHIKRLWNELDDGVWGMSWGHFLEKVRNLPKGAFWRHAQAGDLPGKGTAIDVRKLLQLVDANRGKRGYTYTHKAPSNLSAVREACRNGFTVNASADGPSKADELFDAAVPVVSIVPFGTPAVSYTPRGRKIIVCPAQRKEGLTCNDCRICAVADRPYIVGFLPHGIQAKRVDCIARAN